jgi:hypothetical protein
MLSENHGELGDESEAMTSCGTNSTLADKSRSMLSFGAMLAHML